MNLSQGGGRHAGHRRGGLAGNRLHPDNGSRFFPLFGSIVTIFLQILFSKLHIFSKTNIASLAD